MNIPLRKEKMGCLSVIKAVLTSNNCFLCKSADQLARNCPFRQTFDNKEFEDTLNLICSSGWEKQHH